MFTASSDSILREFTQLSHPHYPPPTMHIKPCFVHEHLADWQSVLCTNTWQTGNLFCARTLGRLAICFVHEHLADWQSVLQLHFTAWSKAVPKTTVAKSDILLQMRFAATCRVPLPMHRWIVLVSICEVEACSSSHPCNSFAIQQNKSLFPLPLRCFSFFSCEFDFVVNTKRLLVVSYPPTAWPNRMFSHRYLYSCCCLVYFYILDFGCRLCTGRGQNFAVLRLNVK